MKLCTSFVAILLSISTLACGTFLRAVEKPKPTSDQELAVEQRQPEPYRVASVIVWDVDSMNARIEARMETLNEPESNIFAIAPTRLIIKNLSMNQLLFEEKSGDSFVSMYARDLNDDYIDELIVTWAAGSSYRIQIIAVDTTRADVILNESYRLDAALVDLSGVAKVDVLITTGNSGVGPFYTTRYVWTGEQYKAVGQMPYEKLINIIKKQFTKNRP